jgi:hypothetical protein
MPTANESYCQLQSADSFDAVRREPNDLPEDDQAKVDGRRVIRVYGIDDDESELIGFVYRRRDDWDEHEDRARAHCRSHDGRFEPMPNEASVRVYYDEKGPAQALVSAAIETAANDEPQDGWYPLIPIGTFEHQVHGTFEVSPEDAEAYVANFEAGLPWGRAGIPIDENGFHQKQAEAYGRISQMEVREDAVWGYIVWGNRGRNAVAAGEYMYVSPTFYPRGREFNLTSGKPTDNVVVSVALTNGPFFAGQPGLFEIAAAAYTPLAASSEATSSDAPEDETADESSNSGAETPPEVTYQMDETQIAEIRAKYEAANGEVSDDEWAKLTADFDAEEDWTAFADAIEEPAEEEEEEEAPEEGTETADEISISRAELERLQEKAKLTEDAVERADRAEKTAQEAKEIAASVQVKNRRLELEDAVKASTYEDGRKAAPGAVKALVDLQMNPCDETVKAMIAHLEDNGGSLALYEKGETEAIRANSGLSEDARWLEEKDITEQTKQQVRAIAEADECSFQAAYGKFLDGNRRE